MNYCQIYIAVIFTDVSKVYCYFLSMPVYQVNSVAAFRFLEYLHCALLDPFRCGSELQVSLDVHVSDVPQLGVS